MLNKWIGLLHDIACPNPANPTQDFIRLFGWQQFDHPPYSPGLAQIYYHMFLLLKMHLGGKCHDNDDEVKTTLLQWLSNQVVDFYEDEFEMPAVRYDKCLNIIENYIKNYIKV